CLLEELAEPARRGYARHEEFLGRGWRWALGQTLPFSHLQILVFSLARRRFVPAGFDRAPDLFSRELDERGHSRRSCHVPCNVEGRDVLESIPMLLNQEPQLVLAGAGDRKSGHHQWKPAIRRSEQNRSWL